MANYNVNHVTIHVRHAQTHLHFVHHVSKLIFEFS